MSPASSLTRTPPSLSPKKRECFPGPSDPRSGSLAVTQAPAMGLAGRETLQMRRSPAPGLPRKGLCENPGRPLGFPLGTAHTELLAEGCSAPPAPSPCSYLLLIKQHPRVPSPRQTSDPFYKHSWEATLGSPHPRRQELGTQLHPANWPASPAPPTPCLSPLGPDASGTSWTQCPLTPVSHQGSRAPHPGDVLCGGEVTRVGTCVPPRKFLEQPHLHTLETRSSPCPSTRPEATGRSLPVPKPGSQPQGPAPWPGQAPDAERYSRRPLSLSVSPVLRDGGKTQRMRLRDCHLCRQCPPPRSQSESRCSAHSQAASLSPPPASGAQPERAGQDPGEAEPEGPGARAEERGPVSPVPERAQSLSCPGAPGQVGGEPGALAL